MVRKLGFAENKMALYEGNFEIPVILPTADMPPRSILFLAQACSDKICLDPEALLATLMPMGRKR